MFVVETAKAATIVPIATESWIVIAYNFKERVHTATHKFNVTVPSSRRRYWWLLVVTGGPKLIHLCNLLVIISRLCCNCIFIKWRKGSRSSNSNRHHHHHHRRRRHHHKHANRSLWFVYHPSFDEHSEWRVNLQPRTTRYNFFTRRIAQPDDIHSMRLCNWVTSVFIASNRNW